MFSNASLGPEVASLGGLNSMRVFLMEARDGGPDIADGLHSCAE